ncbi:MAG: acyltransferase [Sphingomonas sp.]
MLNAPTLPTQNWRLSGLDSIRIVCAFMVALNHFGGKFGPDLQPLVGERLAWVINELIGIIPNGPAAVIVFFVLSGFVVHLPRVEGRPLQLPEYLCRRYVRIAPAAALTAIVYFSLGVIPAGMNVNASVLWSIVCELIYYGLYPLIIRSRIPIAALMIGAFCLVFAIAFGNHLPAHSSFTTFGYGSWLIGLPCWLAGCWLAENYTRFPAWTDRRLWIVRGAIWALGAAQMLWHWHGNAGVFSSNIFSLVLFTVPATLWLGLEARALRASPPPLDRLGAASYSLYLAHPVALWAFASFDHRGWLLLLAYAVTTTAFTMVCYFGVERPTHRLAKRLGRLVRSKTKPSLTTSLAPPLDSGVEGKIS